MSKDEKKRLAEILYGMAGNFGDRLDVHTLRLWSKLFKADGINLDQVEDAALKIVRTKTFPKMPTYAKFMESIYGSPTDRAQQQADVVVKMLRRSGSYAPVRFDDPVTEYLMKFRWPYRTWAANVLEKELVWWRKEFVEAYRGYAKRPGIIGPGQQISACEAVKALIEGEKV